MASQQSCIRYSIGMKKVSADASKVIKATIAPLGSLMRARLKAYQALSACRHVQNRQPRTNPTGLHQVPN